MTHIMIRVTEDQKEALAAKAARVGLRLSTYVRMLALKECDKLSETTCLEVTDSHTDKT